MTKTELVYFKDVDTLHLQIAPGRESASVEISHDITAELDDNGELIGIEILKASRFLEDTILESVQAKLLNLVKQREPMHVEEKRSGYKIKK